MKKVLYYATPLLFSACMLLCSCGPTDDKGGMDTENSSGEGSTDSSKLPNIDTTGMTPPPADTGTFPDSSRQ